MHGHSGGNGLPMGYVLLSIVVLTVLCGCATTARPPREPSGSVRRPPEPAAAPPQVGPATDSSSAWLRHYRATILASRGAFQSCQTGGPAAEGQLRCVCQVVCSLRFVPRPDEGPVSVRYPLAEVGGLAFEIDAAGRPVRCSYRSLGGVRPIRIEVACSQAP